VAWWKFAIALFGAGSLLAMCAAFWLRSWKLALVVINLIMVAKITWT